MVDDPYDRTRTYPERVADPAVAPVATEPVVSRPVEPVAPATTTYDRPLARTETIERERAIVDDRGPFSVLATFLGWCVASFLMLALIALVAAALGGATADAADDAISGNDVTTLGIAGLVGGLVAIFIAYLAGGYTAGRLARARGVAHGAAVPVWTILVGIILVAAGAALGTEYAYLTYLNPFPGLDLDDVTTGAVIGAILALAAMFAGAILGGVLGDRWDDARVAGTTRRRTMRGRPL